MDQRLQLVSDHQRALYDMTTLCARYGVSRNTGYKWLARFAAKVARGLHERSHAPHACPHRIGDALAELLVQARRAHPPWGPAKVVQYLRPRHPRVGAWPAVSTVADLFARHGLVAKRRRRRPVVHPGTVPIHTARPTTSGRPTSRGSSARRTASTASRSPAPTSTAATSSPCTGS